MQEILQSFNNVILSPLFMVYMSFIITFGMWIGIRLDNGIQGFKRSIVIILPFIFVILLANTSRIYQASFVSPLPANAFNGIITTIITSFFYIVGLIIGHIIWDEARNRVQKHI